MFSSLPAWTGGESKRGERALPAQFPSFRAIDYSVYALILALGALPFFLYQRLPDFIYEDVSFFELTKSLLQNGFYGFNFVPEKVQPPGLSLLLAAICITFGCTHAALLRAMPVFLTLGFLVSYELIRREQGRGIAAAVCLVLGSSPAVFLFATQVMFPSLPYFFTSMSALFAASRLEEAETRPARVLWGLIFCLLGLVSLMIQSVGIALFGGLLGWLTASFLIDSRTARSRLKIFLPILVLGISVEGLWIHRGSNPPEWPLAGYPGSYISQLALKSGNHPELGQASAEDILLRVDRNLRERAGLFGELLTRHWVNPSWSSIGTAGVVLLIVLGVGSSLLRRGGQIWDWYFIAHECIYLLWPWPVEIRFFLPIAPLACLYLYKGVLTIAHLSSLHPRRVGAIALFPSLLLAIHSRFRGWQAGKNYGLQYDVSSIFWVTAALVSAWIVWKGSIPRLEALSLPDQGLRRRYCAFGESFTLSHALRVVMIAFLITVGVMGQLRIGRENLNLDESKRTRRPDIEAAEWIRLHTEQNVVISARHVPVVYHYAQRKVIWFPPISNPQILMQGIRRHHIQYIIIIDRDFSYYMPPDEYCFEKLYNAFPGTFRLVENKGQIRIYEVLPDSGT
jgi:hypothetical protein